MEVVTYANKSSGLFEELVHNEYDVPVRVLGWGTKWNGYSDKSKGMLEYLNTSKNDDDIVVFIDGFDSKINKDPKEVVDIFKSHDCRVLFSKHPDIISKYIVRQVFPMCTTGGMANAGMYMGYVKELKIILENELHEVCQDDQVNFNKMCEKYDFIKVDEDGQIFENMSPFNMKAPSDAVFVSYPGTPTFERIIRACRDYAQFFKWQFIIAMLVLLLTLPKRNKWVPFYLTLLGVLFYVLQADKSCAQ
jgi:hypothetical protein